MTIVNTLNSILSHPLNRRRRFLSMFRFLSWQIKSRFQKTDHIIDWIEGSRLLARNGETSITGNLYCGLMEFEDMSFLLHFLRPSDSFVDIGANSGSFTILASKVSGVNVIAFEPSTETCNRLKANVKLNEVTDKVLIKNFALGGEQGLVQFSTELDAMNHVLREKEIGTRFVTVRKSTLDNEIETVPQILKIDVEGFEFEVLCGANKTLSSESLQAIIVELNGSGISYGINDDDVSDIIVSNGFHAVTYNPINRKIELLNIKHNSHGNTIFVRNLEYAQSRVKNGKAFTVNGIEL